MKHALSFAPAALWLELILKWLYQGEAWWAALSLVMAILFLSRPARLP